MVQGRTYTREDIERELDRKVQASARQWGENYIYTKWAKESKEKKLAQYDNGEVILVETEPYCENGIDYEINYYSDGTADTTCYGYND